MGGRNRVCTLPMGGTGLPTRLAEECSWVGKCPLYLKLHSLIIFRGAFLHIMLLTWGGQASNVFGRRGNREGSPDKHSQSIPKMKQVTQSSDRVPETPLSLSRFFLLLIRAPKANIISVVLRDAHPARPIAARGR